MASNMFMKFSNNIKGESEDKAHIEWCEITSLDQEFTQDASPTEEGDQDTSKAEHGEVKITKYIDEASTALMKACWDGTKLDRVMIECYRASGGSGPVKYFIIVLEGVIIKKFNYKGGEGDIVSEDLELVAAKATYTYRAMDKKQGTAKPRKIASHDLRSNVVA